MARAAGLGYGELFYFAYPDRFDPKTASPAARTIVSMLEGLHPSQSRLGPPPSSEPPAVSGKKEKGKAEKEAVPADLEEVVRRVMEEIQRQQAHEKGGPKVGNGSNEP